MKRGYSSRPSTPTLALSPYTLIGTGSFYCISKIADYNPAAASSHVCIKTYKFSFYWLLIMAFFFFQLPLLWALPVSYSDLYLEIMIILISFYICSYAY